MSSVRRLAVAVAVAVAVVAGALALAGCSGDDSSGDDAAATTTTTVAEVGGAGLPADACSLVPAGSALEGTDFAVPDGVAGGDEQRRVCTFVGGQAGEVSITVGVEGQGRFDEKVAASQNALGVEGDPADGLGDRARFFFSDRELPEGVAGVVVASGDLTVDVTVQGLGEDAARPIAVGLARLAVSNL